MAAWLTLLGLFICLPESSVQNLEKFTLNLQAESVRMDIHISRKHQFRLKFGLSGATFELQRFIDYLIIKIKSQDPPNLENIQKN